MNNILFNTLLATGAISLLSLAGIFTLYIKENMLHKMSYYLVSFSAGALIGGAFFHLIPEVSEMTSSHNTYYYIVAGIVIFFVLEKFLKWHHCHEEEECEVHTFTYMSIVGDSLHNFLDGLVIASAFSVSVELGFATTIAVAAHELPQEIGDFGILVHGGFSKIKALLWNFFSSITALIGGVIGFLLIDMVDNISLILLPFAAGGFIYIAMSDLIPEIHKINNFKKSTASFIIFTLGLAFMIFAKLYLGE